MTAPVFVDTNVFLYARDSRDAPKQRAATEWLGMLWEDRSGRTSVQVLSEYYVNATRKLARDEAWDDIHALLSWEPQQIDQALLLRGREVQLRYQVSWWDALIVAAAQVQGCGLLLTEDLQDHAVYGGVTVRSPFTLCVGDASTSYVDVPTPPSRHRRPGRPKRKPGNQRRIGNR